MAGTTFEILGQPEASADATKILHDRVSFSFPAAVARRREESKLRLRRSNTGSMKASTLLLDVFTASFAPLRASKSTRLF
ncbi:hypothetical protein [Microcoleus sp. D2_18a_D3]|uniref:hypothetical protein n=1 Tax=Microcoleus sp. D2_18a_D3 TaxID=3055330 RepID=UPI002FD2C535